MALLFEAIDDFVNTTLPLIKRGKWTDLSLEYQEYVSAGLIDAKKVVEQGGQTVSFRIKTKNTGLARNVGLYATDVTGVEDVTIQASVPWSKQTVNWSYDIDEDLFQSDRETIIREMMLREHAADCDMAELNEVNLWSGPSSTTDPRPMGIPFWVQKSVATPDGAFNGGNPSTHAAGCAGVSSVTYPRWRNWAFKWTQPTVDDLVRKIKKALAWTNFQSPVPHPELGYGKAEYNMYTTYRVTEPLERLAESRNDNLGRDLARYVNTVVIGGVPIKFVPYLEANDTSDPVYGVCWRWFRPYVKRGANMRRNPPKPSPFQHTTRTVHIDNWMQYICVNRRGLFVGSKA